MSRKSKKGFKRLENHELTEFSALNGGRAGDSESEDLLDLTRGERHETSDRYYSCCCWCSCLYLVLLTFVVAVLGVFCGYLMYNVWQINSDTGAAHKELKDSIEAMQRHLDEVRKDTGNKFIMVRRDVARVNNTIAELQAVTIQLRTDVRQLDARLKVIESQPQEQLIQQVERIHREMLILNHNMDLLNSSLEDVQEMRAKVASVGSIIDSYSAEFNHYQRQIGDVKQSNTEIRNDVIAADDKLKTFGDQLAEVKNSVTTSHDQMRQSDDLLSAQLTHLQTVVADLNTTLDDEVGRIWTNITKVETKLDSVGQKLSTVEQKLEAVDNREPMPAITQPSHPSTTTPSAETRSTIMTTRPLSDPSVATESVVTTWDENNDAPMGDYVTGVTTGATKRVTAKPQKDTPGTTDNIWQEESTVEPVESFSNSTDNVTKSDNVTVAEEDAITTSNLPPTSEDVIMQKKKKNEQAMAALKIYINDFPLMDRNGDGRLTPSEMGNANPQVFNLLDANEDGSVSLTELQHMMSVLQTKHNSLKYDKENGFRKAGNAGDYDSF